MTFADSILTELTAAGCGLRVSIGTGRRVPPRNLLDMELPGADRDGDEDIKWAVSIRPGPSSQDPGPEGWSGSPTRRAFRGAGFNVVFEERTSVAHFDPGRIENAFTAAQFAVFGALRREGRADLHASAVVPRGSAAAIVLVGEAGHGKSTMTLTALSEGWGFLSDDLIALFVDKAGALTLSPLRRTLRVAESAIPLLPPGARAGTWTEGTPRKMVVDPEACGLGPRHLRIRPGRLVFLEHGARKRILPLLSGEAFQRLILHSPHIAFDPDARAAISALKRLADEVPARSAALPLDSLHDAATLEDFLA